MIVVRAWTTGGDSVSVAVPERELSGSGFWPEGLKRQDIGGAEVAADLLGHDVISLGQKSAASGHA